VLFRLWVTVLLGHTKIDHMDDTSSLGSRSANKEVVWLDVAVDQILLVDGLHTGKLGMLVAVRP
jgi:hypothetical protein